MRLSFFSLVYGVCFSLCDFPAYILCHCFRWVVCLSLIRLQTPNLREPRSSERTWWGCRPRPPLHALRSTSRPLAWNLGLVAPLCYLLPVTARLCGVTWLEDRERENQQEFAHTCEAQNSPGWSGRLRPLLPLWVLLLCQRWCRLLVSGLLWDQEAGSGGHQRKMMRTRPCASPPPPRPLLRQSPQSRSRHSVQDWSLHSVWWDPPHYFKMICVFLLTAGFL